VGISREYQITYDQEGGFYKKERFSRFDGSGYRLRCGANVIADAPEFSDWSAPVNVEPPTNTSFVEGGDVV
jgi:hypothetical protein